MDATQTPMKYQSDPSDDVFAAGMDNNVQYVISPHPQYNARRSSSVTTSQTPFIRRESVRRISEGPSFYPPEPKRKSFTAKLTISISVIIVIIVLLAAVAGLLFYRLEVQNNDLQRQLSELKKEYDRLSDDLLIQSKPRQTDRVSERDNEKCLCSSGMENELDAPKGDDEIYPSDGSEPSSILKCCSKNSKQVKTIVEKVFHEEQEKILARMAVKNANLSHMGLGRSTAFAHVNGKKTTVPANNKMKGYITSWMPQPQLLNRVSYHSGVITIEHAGVYFVYSQIYFYQRQEEDSQYQLINNTQSTNHDPMLHETCRNDDPVMKSAVPYREFTSKYHGGVFKLEKGDRISVRVSSNDYQVNMDLTFFGVYSLEEESNTQPTTEKSYTTNNKQ